MKLIYNLTLRWCNFSQSYCVTTALHKYNTQSETIHVTVINYVFDRIGRARHLVILFFFAFTLISLFLFPLSFQHTVRTKIALRSIFLFISCHTGDQQPCFWSRIRHEVICIRESTDSNEVRIRSRNFHGQAEITEVSMCPVSFPFIRGQYSLQAGPNKDTRYSLPAEIFPRILSWLIWTGMLCNMSPVLSILRNSFSENGIRHVRGNTTLAR